VNTKAPERSHVPSWGELSTRSDLPAREVRPESSSTVFAVAILAPPGIPGLFPGLGVTNRLSILCVEHRNQKDCDEYRHHHRYLNGCLSSSWRMYFPCSSRDGNSPPEPKLTFCRSAEQKYTPFCVQPSDNFLREKHGLRTALPEVLRTRCRHF